jgi:hypothetical protein
VFHLKNINNIFGRKCIVTSSLTTPFDKVLYTIDNSIEAARYVVPARRRTIAHADKDVNLDQGKKQYFSFKLLS